MKIYCRKCNQDITDEDHFDENEYSFCVLCKIKKLEKELRITTRALNFYRDERCYKETLNDADGRGMHSLMDSDMGKVAREALDEIKNRSIDLCGKKDKDQEGEVAKIR